MTKGRVAVGKIESWLWVAAGACCCRVKSAQHSSRTAAPCPWSGALYSGLV